MQDIDLTDIARGRRITAVTASELEMVPRKSARPPRPSLLHRIRRRLAFVTLRLLRRFQRPA